MARGLRLLLILGCFHAIAAEDDGCGDEGEEGGGMSAINIISVLLLLCLSGLFSGLNLGLMSFAEDDLLVVIDGSQDEREVRDAKTILPLRKRGNLLLCTLLLGNTLVNALLAILLAGMTSGLIGSIATTVLIVIFGEIGPQALCSRYALAIGAKAVPVVYFFMVLVFIFAYPISRMLDYLLGAEVSSLYTKQELLSLIALNVNSPKHQAESKMTAADQKLMAGALTFREKKVDNAMTPIDGVFKIPKSAVLDQDFIRNLLEKGYTRVPVYDDSTPGTRIVAFLYMKDLVGIGFERSTPLTDILDVFNAESRVKRVSHMSSLGEAYETCQKDRLHILVVEGPLGTKHASKRSFMRAGMQNPKEGDAPKEGPMGGGIKMMDLGLITMEDVLEEIVQEEIVDEDDEVVDAAAQSMRNDLSVVRNERRYDPATYIKKLSQRETNSPTKETKLAKKGRGMGSSLDKVV